ncbi:hypothetical protein MPER_15853, partial [Moniliophthora perniciosa FA553]
DKSPTKSGKSRERIILYIHGAAQRMISIPLSKYTDSLEDLLIPPENIVLAGDSAGGGLCLALLMYLRDNKYPLPSAAILMSPW